MSERVKFHQITQLQQQKLSELVLANFILKGTKNPQEMLDKWKRGIHTRKQWRKRKYYLMKSIDMKREKAGLSKLYT